MTVLINVPETHLNRHPLHLKTMQKNLREIVSNRLFLALVVLMGLTYSLIIVFNTVGPFLIQTQFHYSPVFFGHLALILGVVFLSLNYDWPYILKLFRMERLLLVSVNLFFSIAVIMVILIILSRTVSS